MTKITRGIGISTFNRGNQIRQAVEAVLATKPKDAVVVVADDGSTDKTPDELIDLPIVYIRGTNKGVVANKNRILCALQNCTFIALMEDDLIPQEGGWFEIYERASIGTQVHHFCRVQDKEVPSKSPRFDSYLHSLDCTPVYGSSPRGDFVFLTNRVLQVVGGLNPSFRGVGYGHVEYSNRISKAGLIPHPEHQWIDIKEARDKFTQMGDTSGGRFEFAEEETKRQLEYNRNIMKKLEKQKELFCSLLLE